MALGVDEVPAGRVVWKTALLAEPADVVERLERLAALHDRGALDDEEYETAKDATLRDVAAVTTPVRVVLLVMQIVAIALAIWLGSRFFDAVT